MKPDVLATVIELASLTEDRAPEEQRALIEAAMWVDNERARFLSWRPEPILPYLTALVDATYHPADDDDGLALFEETERGKRPVELTEAQRNQLAKLEAKFKPCDQCGVVKGWHPVKCLKADLRSGGERV